MVSSDYNSQIVQQKTFNFLFKCMAGYSQTLKFDSVKIYLVVYVSLVANRDAYDEWSTLYL